MSLVRQLRPRSAFTLVELLIVIAILSILSVAVVLVLNPAELLRKSRDATRLSDLASLNTAINLLQVDQPSVSLGTAKTIYVSIPDTSATCANIGLPTLPTGFSYHCAPTSTLTKVDGTGWMPANLTLLSTGAPLGRLPLDPINTTSTSNYYTYTPGGSWELTTVMESQTYKKTAANDGGNTTAYEIGSDLTLKPSVFPDNWVAVPGNSSFGTPDFYVMKYEAKCVQASNNVALTAPDTGSHTYDNNSQACTGANYYPSSRADGTPLTNLSHDTAKTYCTNIGAHLLTNDEWMTIARNAEQVASNWSGGSVGSGYIYSGHNDNAPAYAVIADQNDANGYYGETNTGGNQRRTLTLSNGSVVWDLPGNVWEHVQRSTNNAGDATTAISVPPCSSGAGAEYCQYSNGASPYVSSWTSDVPQLGAAPSNTTWSSTQGVGQLYTLGGGGSNGTAFIRGGRWDEQAFGGVFNLATHWIGTNPHSSIGFRCAR